MTTANATTDSTGNMLYSVNTSGKFRARQLTSKTIGVWDYVLPGKSKTVQLVTLLGDSAYDLLARHIHESEKIPLGATVNINRSSRVVEIKVKQNKRDYRLFSGAIYRK